jgi:predicted TIM-barrel enzyme
MAEAGADIIVCHMGLTTGGAIGAETALTLEDCVPRIDEWAAAALAVRPDVIVLCHGGPIADAGGCRIHPRALPHLPRLLRRLQHGAAADRVALTEQTRRFKSIGRR